MHAWIPGWEGALHEWNLDVLPPSIDVLLSNALVDVQDVAGGLLAEMCTAGVGLNTSRMRASIVGSGNEVQRQRNHDVLKDINASGIPCIWSLAMANILWWGCAPHSNGRGT